MCLKDFRRKHKYSIGKQCQMSIWGRSRVKAELLAHLIKGKVWLCLDYSPKDIMQAGVGVGDSPNIHVVMEGENVHVHDSA